MSNSLTPDNLRCPRCDSTDTKFCYYNNYSTSQPRYFCKNCKRYWTAGGSLRNVPIGGGVRKKSKKARRTKQVHDLLLSSSSSAAAGESGHRRAGRNSDLSRMGDPQTSGNPSSTSDSAERDADYETSTGNGHISRGFGTPVSVRRAESVAESQNVYDFYNYITPCVAPVHYGFLDSVKFHAQEYYQDGGLSGFHARNGPDLGRSNCSGDTPEVASMKCSQIGSGAMKDHSSSGTVMGIHGLYHQDQGQDANRRSSVSHDVGQEQFNALDGSSAFEESQYRDKSQTEDEDDDLGDVVNVRYPFDWEQVSEVVFGVTPDYLYLPGH